MLPQNKKTIILIFLSINAVYFFAYFQRIAVPGTIFNELQTSFLLSASAVATLGTLYLYIYGGMQFFAGIMADRLGAGRVLITGGALLSAGSILFPLSHSLTYHFAVGWFLFGYILLAVSSGASPVYTTSMKELNPAEAAATAVGFLNGICYLSVSLFINLAGFGLDRFRASAIHTSQAVIYPTQAYLTIFIGCLLLAAASCFTSFFIHESYGKHIYGTDAT